jgi:CheY-like chemotaxis protein
MAPVAAPDVVILDVMMPKLDGIATAARLRAEPLTAIVPIVALTALTDPEVFRDAIAAGCDMVLNKPIAPSDLLRGVSYLLEEGEHDGPRTRELQRFAVEERSAATALTVAAAPLILELDGSAAVDSEADLRHRLQRTQTVPVCSFCGRVRTEGSRWREMAGRLRAFFDQWTSVSHGVCPECFSREYPGVDRRRG